MAPTAKPPRTRYAVRLGRILRLGQVRDQDLRRNSDRKGAYTRGSSLPHHGLSYTRPHPLRTNNTVALKLKPGILVLGPGLVSQANPPCNILEVETGSTLGMSPRVGIYSFLSACLRCFTPIPGVSQSLYKASIQQLYNHPHGERIQSQTQIQTGRSECRHLECRRRVAGGT